MASVKTLNRSLQTACLLIDLQNDYLERIRPEQVSGLIKSISDMLDQCRKLSVPVLHIRTRVSKDGTNRMPHHIDHDNWFCIEGTTGIQVPEKLCELQGERVFYKKYFSAFSNPDLDNWLKSFNISQLIISGLYTHACVRSTILDAYQSGYKVLVSGDTIGSEEELHSQETIKWLGERACSFMPMKELIHYLKKQNEEGESGLVPQSFQKSYHYTNELRKKAPKFASGFINGKWEYEHSGYYWEQRNPSSWDQCLGYVPICGEKEVRKAILSLKTGQSNWSQYQLSDRLTLLESWANVLTTKKDEIVQLLSLEIGKPICYGVSEFEYGMNLFQAAIDRIRIEKDDIIDNGVKVNYRPFGTVALITPWNNPFAIPIGKIIPALAYGNTVLWKPAYQAPQIVALMIDSMKDAGIKDHCLHLVFGDSGTGHFIASSPEIDAISFTGSTNGGLILSKMSQQYHKKFQAEMGGNNSVIISCSNNIKHLAKQLAGSSFSFSGQRCTAPRRIIIMKDLSREFTGQFVHEARNLKIGLPDDPEVNIGPLISRNKQTQVRNIIDKSIKDGASLLLGGKIPENFETGCWFSPTIVSNVGINSELYQNETFGPVVILEYADNIDDAIELSNNVQHGLSASLYSEDELEINKFVNHAKAGILRINALQGYFHPLAPFGGWKLSGAGQPEHGRWDKEFYTRVQTVYHSK